jgi:hypothetical protein
VFPSAARHAPRRPARSTVSSPGLLTTRPVKGGVTLAMAATVLLTG